MVRLLTEYPDHELTAGQARKLFGDPDQDIGGGLYIYQYPVKEGGYLTLSFGAKLYSAHYDDEVLFSTEDPSKELAGISRALRLYLETLQEDEKTAIPVELRSSLLNPNLTNSTLSREWQSLYPG